MKAHLITIAGYVICTFGVQGTSHFAINAAHYAALPHIRTEPIVALGIISMLIQGTVLSLGYARSSLFRSGVIGAITAAWGLGAIIVSYIALAEFGKYDIAGFSSWVAVEVSAGAVQYTLIGVVLYLAHHGFRRSALAA